jgi:uncharacterized protein YbaP (TraB family)
MTALKKMVLATLALLAGLSLIPFFGAAGAQTVRPALPSGIMAHPALWHIQGEAGQVYLLGAVHVLPPNMMWRPPPVMMALSRADTFVFEVPEDASAVKELHGLIQDHGFLPPDQTLRDLLHPQFRDDYNAAVKSSGLDVATLERERPWLAGIQLMFAQISKLRYAANNGVDSVLMEDAMRHHKPVRYFETIADQFALLAPDDRDLELEEFEAGLKDLRDVAAGIRPMVTAWANGDQAKLDELINGDLNKFPQARKTLLEDRNLRWVPKIEAMLKEKHVFFIVVGAGHLTGSMGVPALLRKAGYVVEGP